MNSSETATKTAAQIGREHAATYLQQIAEGLTPTRVTSLGEAREAALADADVAIDVGDIDADERDDYCRAYADVLQRELRLV